MYAKNCSITKLSKYVYIEYIKNSDDINYHFANCGTFDRRYTNKVNKKLNIQKIFNTNKGINHYKNYLKNNTLFQNEVLFHIYEF